MSLGVNGSWGGSVPSSIPPAFLSHLSPSTDLGVAIFLILIAPCTPLASQPASNHVDSARAFIHFGLVPRCFNWTSTENYVSVYYDPGESLRDVTNPDPYSYSGLGHSLSAASTRSSAPGQEGESETGSNRPVSCLPPMVSLIPAMFAKSHCMINPFIYQIMNKEFREDVYDILFGRQNGERRRMRGRGGTYSDTHKGILSYCHSWRGRSNPKAVPMVELGKKEGW
ncbi:uncharacterized protein LOC115176457 [Salmo trutta]|uniref:uncharacterized protein LOC115176457 n=1 Tax=Salmo trutta TaxID=8032 RepID=UPI001131458A|nr:uncharacterized protein LOC115176457 [Salmo trutta]